MDISSPEAKEAPVRERHWITSGRPVKRSVNIAGHRTSFSLEEPFWVSLREIAEGQGLSVANLIAKLDEIKFIKTANIGLSGAIRIFVFKYYLDELSKATGQKTAAHRLFETVMMDKTPLPLEDTQEIILESSE